jgi:cyclohexa-1,5-dienecarbonyl-CoA hydratase
MNAGPVKTWFDRDGRLLRIALARPKANVLDAAMVRALDDAFVKYSENRDVAAILLGAEGPHFSFGASVEEHLPAACADMLAGFHQLINRVFACPAPVLVAIRGQCLGGGLELASAGHVLFATPEAKLGQPEIQLGVFAPAASCLLPEKVARAHAEDLLISGRSISGAEAAQIGLVNQTAADPDAAALAYFDQQLASKSGSSLRHAVRAARADAARRVADKLAAVERHYLQELMATKDAVEGLNAFIEKRPAKWENR